MTTQKAPPPTRDPQIEPTLDQPTSQAQEFTKTFTQNQSTIGWIVIAILTILTLVTVAVYYISKQNRQQNTITYIPPTRAPTRTQPTPTTAPDTFTPPSEYTWESQKIASESAYFISDETRDLYYDLRSLSGTIWTTSINQTEKSWLDMEQELMKDIQRQLGEEWGRDHSIQNITITAIDADAPDITQQGLVSIQQDQLRVVHWAVGKDIDSPSCPSLSTANCPIMIRIFQSDPIPLTTLLE